MPQEMPDMVRKLRTGFLPSAVQACLKISVSTAHPPASKRSASIGSTEAARLAGYTAERTAITPSSDTDIAPIFQLVSMPLKNGGMGARLNRPPNSEGSSQPNSPPIGTSNI